MKIAVFGKTGQVARELVRRIPDDVTVQTIARDRADFSNPDQVFEAATGVDADVVVNAVAYTAVDDAESEPELAEMVNGTSVGALATACAQKRMPLLHLSTDYVFPGHGVTPWKPTDATGPLCVYGASKLRGEELIRIAGTRAVILRTSWVFSAHGKNFVKSMLHLGHKYAHLPVVSDQIGGPTAAPDIADACQIIARALRNGHEGGTYHYTGAPDTSWAEFARTIFAAAGLHCDVKDIPTCEYPTDADRPLNSRLDCSSLTADFGIQRPDWRQSLRDVLQELPA